MGRYIDTDKLLEEVKRGGHALQEWSTLGVCCVIERQPTADVVPKSEVERWKENFRILDAECSRLEKYESNFYDEVIKAQAEVTREIFEEIEKIATSEGAYDYVSIQEIAEIKKKYTENKE